MGFSDGLRGKAIYPMACSTAARTGMRIIRSTSFPTSLQFMCCQVLRRCVPADQDVTQVSEASLYTCNQCFAHCMYLYVFWLLFKCYNLFIASNIQYSYLLVFTRKLLEFFISCDFFKYSSSWFALISSGTTSNFRPHKKFKPLVRCYLDFNSCSVHLSGS